MHDRRQSIMMNGFNTVIDGGLEEALLFKQSGAEYVLVKKRCDRPSVQLFYKPAT
jgi:hypothetical protein